MTDKNNHIKCPGCGNEIDVQSLLYDEIKNDFNRTRQEELIEERRAMRETIKTQLEEEQSSATEAMQQELAENSKKLKKLHKLRADLAKAKREKEEMSENLNAEAEEKYGILLAKARQDIEKKEKDKNELIILGKDNAIKAQTILTQEMQRRLDEGQQAQGEVQELAIEEWLEEQFSLDTIEEIMKGARGADCLQTVNTRERANCGTIYYESKKTKIFQPNWIEKFKTDIRDKNADIGVLVTQAMPIGMDRLGQREGIWICSYEEFKGLSLVLRESIIQLSSARIEDKE